MSGQTTLFQSMAISALILAGQLAADPLAKGTIDARSIVEPLGSESSDYDPVKQAILSGMTPEDFDRSFDESMGYSMSCSTLLDATLVPMGCIQPEPPPSS
jgi:hypothetical protein